MILIVGRISLLVVGLTMLGVVILFPDLSVVEFLFSDILLVETYTAVFERYTAVLEI
jgi:hypothetical protein